MDVLTNLSVVIILQYIEHSITLLDTLKLPSVICQLHLNKAVCVCVCVCVWILQP